MTSTHPETQLNAGGLPAHRDFVFSSVATSIRAICASFLFLSMSICKPNHRLLTSLPHSHLLEKIRSMGEKAQMKEQNRAGEASAPMPVKRKLIV